VNVQSRSDVSAIKVVVARLQTSVVNRAMQVFGAMGLSPDTQQAYFWTRGHALHLLDGPDARSSGVNGGLLHLARATAG